MKGTSGERYKHNFKLTLEKNRKEGYLFLCVITFVDL